MRIRPTMNRDEVDGGGIGAQMIDWGTAGIFGIPLAVIGLLAAFAGLADSIGWPLAFALAALFTLPMVIVSIAWLVRKMAQRLEFSGGVLTYRDWRQRTMTLGAPQDLLVTRGQVSYESTVALDVPIVVVEGSAGTEPVLLRARHWRRTDLSALWRQMRVRPVGRFDRVYSAEELQRQFPGIRLPWSLARPTLVWGVTTLVILGWIVGVILLIVQLVE